MKGGKWYVSCIYIFKDVICVVEIKIVDYWWMFELIKKV